jgi:hypothetical protein
VTEGLQLAFFPERVTFVARRRFVGGGRVRWRRERVTGAVLERIRVRRGWVIALVQVDGRRCDGSPKGCLVQVDAAELEPCPPKQRKRRPVRRKGGRRG